MPAKQLKEFLHSHKVKYLTMTHSTAYTAQEIASLEHIRGEDFAKTVIVRIDGSLVMAVLPASYQADLPLLKAAAKAKKIALASETHVRDRFPEPVRCHPSSSFLGCQSSSTKASQETRRSHSTPARTTS